MCRFFHVFPFNSDAWNAPFLRNPTPALDQGLLYAEVNSSSVFNLIS
jgi:hypothetical protein